MTVKTAFVLFDAWRYDGDSLRREFIRTAGESLRSQGALKRDFDFERHIESFETEMTVSRRRLGFDAVALRDGAIAAFLVVAIVAAMIFLLPKVGLSRSTTLKVLIAISSAATAFVLFALQRVVAPDPVQATRRRLEFPDQFAKNFKELLDNVCVRRLVIAIDNLDRCSPPRVTEVLSSIKTFLEPAFAEGSATSKVPWREVIRQVILGRREEDSLSRMCFIVAADDAALRRHLTAQELSKKSWRDNDQTTESPVEVRTAVDEYLRKFFGASLRIRNLLDEDIRLFTGEELEKFNRSRELSEELSRRLIEMTSQGLKRNPRRIKQFVNNLQMRLQMLAERKAQERVQIDANVLVVAKLAILEEEFIKEFEELESNPTLLGTWHIRARASAEDGDGPPLDPAFASFLRFTDDIQPRDIRAYLNLKQTKSELNLPRYNEFVDLLDDGDVERLGQLLGDDQGEEAKYTEAARAYFLEQRREGGWSRAHNALRSIIETPLLHGEEGEAVRVVLDVALQEPSLESRLGQLEPDTLLAVATRYELAPLKLRRVVAQVIKELGSSSSKPRQAASTALAVHDAIIETDGKLQVKEILSREEVRTDFDSYLPLARSIPEVLSHEILDAALARLEELGTEGISTDNSAFVVAVESLVAHNDPGRLERLLVLTRAALPGYLESGAEEFGRVAEEFTRVIETGEKVAPMAEFADWLVGNRAAVPASSRRVTLNLVLALSRHSSDTEANVGTAVADWLFELEEGADTVAILSEGFDMLPSQVRTRTAELVAEMLAGTQRNLSDAQVEEVFALFPPEDQMQITHNAVNQAISLERPEVANAILKRLDSDVGERVINEILTRAEESPGSQIGDVKFVISQRSGVDEARLFGLAMSIAEVLFKERGTVQQLAPELGKVQLSSAEHRLSLVEHMIKTERDMSKPVNREAMLRAAWSVAGKPRSKARSMIRERLKEIETDPPVAAVAAELLGD